MATVVVVHVPHTTKMSGQPRWWHLTHILMAVGMIVMFVADPMKERHLNYVLMSVFVVATAVVVALTVALARREGGLNPLWAATAVETAIMVYMPAVDGWPAVFPATLTLIIAGYCAFHAVAWPAGLWGRVLAPPRGRFSLRAPHGLTDRLCHAVMSASMAFMLASMAL